MQTKLLGGPKIRNIVDDQISANQLIVKLFGLGEDFASMNSRMERMEARIQKSRSRNYHAGLEKSHLLTS